MDSLRCELQKQLNTIVEKQLHQPTYIEVKTQLDDLDQQINKKLVRYALEKGRMQDRKEWTKLITDRIEIEKQNLQKLTLHTDQINQLEILVNFKAEQNEFECLKIYTDELPTKPDMNVLKDKIYAAFNNFERVAEEYKTKFENNCEIVRRFDEVLSLKCSKQSLDNQVQVLEDLIDQKVEEVTETFSELHEQLQKNETKLNEFTKLVNENISNAVQKSLKREVQNVMQQLKPEFDEKVMCQILATKVNKEDLEKIHEEKANKYEFENMKDFISLFSDQLKHAISLISEVVKLNINKGIQSKNGSDQKAIILLKQIQALNSWTLRNRGIEGAETDDLAFSHLVSSRDDFQDSLLSSRLLELKDVKQKQSLIIRKSMQKAVSRNTPINSSQSKNLQSMMGEKKTSQSLVQSHSGKQLLNELANLKKHNGYKLNLDEIHYKIQKHPVSPIEFSQRTAKFLQRRQTTKQQNRLNSEPPTNSPNEIYEISILDGEISTNRKIGQISDVLNREINDHK